MMIIQAMGLEGKLKAYKVLLPYRKSCFLIERERHRRRKRGAGGWGGGGGGAGRPPQ